MGALGVFQNYTRVYPVLSSFINVWVFFQEPLDLDRRGGRRKANISIGTGPASAPSSSKPRPPLRRDLSWGIRRSGSWGNLQGLGFLQGEKSRFSCRGYFFFFKLCFSFCLTRAHTLSPCFSCSRRMYVYVYRASKLRFDFYTLLFPSSPVPAPIWQENGQEEELCLTGLSAIG